MKKLIYSKEDLDLILTLELEEKDKEIERLHSIIEQIEGALYNTNLSNMDCRITIQEILDKE